MPRVLPPHPNVDHLRNEAKALLKAHHDGDASVCGTLRRLRRFQDGSDEHILAAELALTEAQFALAMDYGFRDWYDLRQHVLTVARRPGPEIEPRPGAFLLKDPPPGRKGINRFAYGYFLSLRYCGAACDYDTIMGDSGLAFILQADTKHTAWGKPVEQLDIGWWPLDSWGALLRVDFVGRAVGLDLRSLPYDDEQFRPRPAETYDRLFHKPTVECLRAGRPPVAVENDVYLVTGYDDGQPPLLGQCSCLAGHKIGRLAEYPWRIIVPGEPVKPMDRRRADLEALEFAVAVARDRLGDRAPANKLSGQEAFALWARLLRDPEGWGAHFYHNNVLIHLRSNRASAVPYLEAMSQRHPGAVASHLQAAAAAYAGALDELKVADTSKQTLRTSEGREELARLVERAARREDQAADRIQAALAKMQ